MKIPNPDKKYRGDEPDCGSLNPSNPTYNIDLAKLLSWYNYDNDYKLSKEFVKEYLKQTKCNGNIDERKLNLTHSVLARIIVRGGVLSEDHLTSFKQYIRDVTTPSAKPVVETKEAAPRVSIQEAMQEKISEYLGELEGVLDDVVQNDVQFNLYNDLKGKQIPQPYCTSISNWIDWKLEEFTQIRETEDLDIIEAYSFLGARKIAKIIKFLEQCKEDVAKYNSFKKANRKIRTRKAKPASQQVAKLKYLKEFAELNLKSVTVTEIVGASQVWVYNTKTKKLAAYRTDSAQGIQVKGTTLQNYDPEVSEQRTLRNPDKTLKLLLGAGKIQLRKILTDLSTKTGPVNGRINEECILVRAIK
mgnify:CR=1 FL=1